MSKKSKKKTTVYQSSGNAVKPAAPSEEGQAQNAEKNVIAFPKDEEAPVQKSTYKADPKPTEKPVSRTETEKNDKSVPAEKKKEDPYIEFSEVRKTYRMGDTVINAVNDVSFTICKGELAVILGASGAGKTTILNILGGIDVCDSGRITVDGKDVSALNEKSLIEYRRYDIGFVFQFYNLVQNLTARENVELAVQICPHHLDVDETIAAVGLAERMDNFPSQLSGGEQQRVAIARALAKSPKLLLCDEPTGALDYVTGKKILSLLQETCYKTGMTVVLITHNSAIAQIADRVIRMRSGKVESITVNEQPMLVDDIEW